VSVFENPVQPFTEELRIVWGDSVYGGAKEAGDRDSDGAGRGDGSLVWLVMKEVLVLVGVGLFWDWPRPGGFDAVRAEATGFIRTI
jgi:hypothetical protein